MRTAEERIIGGLLTGTSKEFKIYANQIDANTFKTEAYQAIFRRMEALVMEGKDYDLSVIAHEFKGDHIITPEFLIGLIDPGATPHNTPNAIATLNSERFRENITDIVSRKMQVTTGEIASQLQDAVWRYHGGVPNSWQIEEALQRTLDRVESRMIGEQEFIYGIPEMDRVLGGLHRKETTVISARPGTGKSSLAMNIAYTQLERDKKVLYIDLESGDESMLERFLCRITGIGIDTIHQGRNLTAGQLAKLANAAQKLKDMPLTINDRAAITVGEIYNQALDTKADLIIVDYLNLMASNVAISDEVGKLGQMSLGLHEASKNLNIPIIILAQMNRGPENRNDHRPTIADIRGSGKIEEHADNIILLYWEHKYDMTRPEGVSEAIIAKQRQGPVGIAPLSWRAEILRFGTLQGGTL